MLKPVLHYLFQSFCDTTFHIILKSPVEKKRRLNSPAEQAKLSRRLQFISACGR
jgi:hypothetical protein